MLSRENSLVNISMADRFMKEAVYHIQVVTNIPIFIIMIIPVFLFITIIIFLLMFSLPLIITMTIMLLLILMIMTIITSPPLPTVLPFSLLPLRAALTQGSSGLLYKKNYDKEKGKAKFDWVCRTFNCVYTTGIKVVLLVGLIFAISCFGPWR